MHLTNRSHRSRGVIHQLALQLLIVISILLLAAPQRVSAFATPPRPGAAANNKTPPRTWDENLQALITYKECFGNCNVPSTFKEDTKLGYWASNQRKRKLKLSQEQRDALDAIGFDWDPLMTAWKEMFERLKEYKKKHGDCNVPQSLKEDSVLPRWVMRQRQSKSKLSQDQRDALDAIGFDWEPLMTAWKEMFERLKEYKKKHGDCNVPRSFTVKADSMLANWVKTQRQIKLKLSQEQCDALDSIGFDWDPYITAWNEMLEQLKDYKKKHGDCNVPSTYTEDSGLAGWVARQRAIKSKLSQEQRKALDAIGFDWDPLMTAWKEMYKKLKEYKDTNGDCNVPTNHTYAILYSWVLEQRTNHERLIEHQRNALNEIGFDWDPHETEWCTMYERLVVYKESHGNCRVPKNYTEDLPLVRTETDDDFRVQQSYSEDQLLGHSMRTQTHGDCCFSQNYTDCKGKLLGLWVRSQRDLKRQDRLDPSREQRLNAIQFTWSKPRKPAVCTSDEDWDEMHQELVAFKEKHGHINVGKVCNKLTYLLSHDRWFHSLLQRQEVLEATLEKRQTLADWIRAQRDNGLSIGKKRREALNALGFEWEVWHVRYWELGAFKAENGHCNVPLKYSNNEILGRWVSYQRKNKKRQLEQYPKRQRRLELLKFDWVPQETAWQKMFARLKTYQQQYGNCNVPSKYQADSALGIWVSDQRSEWVKAKLSDVRRDALDSIGFEWDRFEADWQHMFQQLEAYKTIHGDCNVPARYTADRELGAWVCKQRSIRHEMSPERRQRLESIGFDWDPFETAWIRMYEKLVVYQKREGHCRVPQSDPQLGIWVSTQRQRKAKHKINHRHEQLLDEIGFVWSVRKTMLEEDKL